MAIVTQRHVAQNTAFATSHSTSIQVDSAANLGLLVCIDAFSAAPASVTYNSTALTSLGSVSATNGNNSWWYLAAPSTGTNTLAWSFAADSGARALVWVLQGVHQTTAPSYLAGTNGATISWAWTGRAVGDFIACVASRRTGATWATGGGLTEDSDATYVANSGSINRGVGAGSLIADATSETPTFTSTGGDSGTNAHGSVAWSEAAGAATNALRSMFYHLQGMR